MLMYPIAHGGCTDTVRKSALEADSGRKIPCPTGDSNPRQCWAWLFSRTLYQLSYPGPIAEPNHLHSGAYKGCGRTLRSDLITFDGLQHSAVRQPGVHHFVATCMNHRRAAASRINTTMLPILYATSLRTTGQTGKLVACVIGISQTWCGGGGGMCVCVCVCVCACVCVCECVCVCVLCVCVCACVCVCVCVCVVCVCVCVSVCV